MAARRLEQLEGADDVGLDEGAGVVDRAVDVALGGEVERPPSGRCSAKSAAHRGAVGDVALDEAEARVVEDVGEVLAGCPA